MKRVQIFHISEFGGHSKAAQNIKEAFLFKHPDIDVATLNGLGHFYPHGEKVIDLLYVGMIKHFPHLWGKAYDRRKIVAALTPYRRLIHRFTFPKLSSLIKDSAPDCFVATQAFPCGLIADYKERKGLKIPLVGIVTDYHPNRFWVHPCVDRYVVACQEAKEVLVAEGIKEQKVRILGIPISVKFLTAYPREQISQELGFSKSLSSVLIMGGGLGLGPFKIIAQELDALDCPFQMIVVCGRNRRLHEWFLRNKSKFKKPIFAFGYTDQIHRLMDFSDIIITKGGGITISEALAKGSCIVVTSPIPGQEEKNVEYLLARQALLKADTPEQIGGIIDGILRDQKKMYFFREMAKKHSIIDSSLRIVDLILELIS
jgi:processive 1,2-diacylglycerol beta-glucosyltransferase